ncbi:MAG: energy coupling factor transporter S component ThiW [Promethearchaeota archaeon]
MNEKIVDTEEKSLFQKNLTKKIALTAIFIAVGLVLSYINPFAYFLIAGTRINPFAHFINAITGVLIGLTFSCITALGIASLRFILNIGTIHAFHGGISGALVVGAVSHLLRKKFPKYVEFAAFFEPIGTVFIGGTIGQLVAPIGTIFAIDGFLTYWGLFAMSCIPGSLLGYVVLSILEKTGITWKDFYD